MATNTNRAEELEAKLERMRELLIVAPLPVLQHLLEIVKRASGGPVTRMRARTRARAHAIPPPLLAANPYKTRAAGNADGPGKCGRAG